MTGRHGESADHESLEVLAVGWAMNALDDGDELRFASHVARCDDCQQIVDDAHAALGEMAYAAPDADPPSGGRDRLMAAVARSRQAHRDTEMRDTGMRDTGMRDTDTSSAQVRTTRSGRLASAGRATNREDGRHPGHRAADVPAGLPDADSTVVPASELARRRTARSRVLVAAAATFVLIAALVGWNITVQADRSRSTAAAARAEHAVTILASAGTSRVALTNSDGSAVATVVHTGGGYDVVTTAMPENNTGSSVYVLWGIAKNAAPTAIGTFDVVHNGVDVRVVPSTSTGTDYAAYAVSRETGRQAPQTPSSVMASGTVGI